MRMRFTKMRSRRCEISTASKLVFDEFEKNNALGSLISDRPCQSHMTSACGVVEQTLNREHQLTWHNMDITREFSARNSWGRLQRPSGLPVCPVQANLRWQMSWKNVWLAMGKHTMLLDGDNVRMGLNREPWFPGGRPD